MLDLARVAPGKSSHAAHTTLRWGAGLAYIKRDTGGSARMVCEEERSKVCTAEIPDDIHCPVQRDIYIICIVEIFLMTNSIDRAVFHRVARKEKQVNICNIRGNPLIIKTIRLVVANGFSK
eukprot:TRINITY_DN1851_c0_g1_i1.p1 TRINITY_DN1851_c0_g1~~TRINITY_DN1851_c0_g1_i1.p1  ORF type:complete len:121 (-),score=19.89 TRINITY_DN1851_c0_g1_i1:126-488(-)